MWIAYRAVNVDQEFENKLWLWWTDTSYVWYLQGPAGKAAPPSGMTFKEAIIFIVGGGNYLEAESLMTWASKTVPAKNIVYGASELLTGERFAQQLAALGKISAA